MTSSQDSMVGNTRFNEPVYLCQPVPISTNSTAMFPLQKFSNIRGHFDAYAIFHYLQTKEFLRFGETEFFSLYEIHGKRHYLMVGSNRTIKILSRELNLQGLFD